MAMYEVEVEPVAPDRFGALVPALPGLLLFGGSVEVLERARAAIEFHVAQATVGALGGSGLCYVSPRLLSQVI